jgi:lysophospholipase L1-like esterase
MNFKKLILFALLLGLLIPVKAQSTIPRFKKGDRVVFVGNSITHGGHYHSFIWLYYMTHFPNERITIFNGGIGGDSSWDIRKRLEKDVFSKNPTYITLTFGMNDVGYYNFYKKNAEELAQQQIQKSYKNFLAIEKRLKEAPNDTKVLIGGSPYDETSKIKKELFPKKNEALLKVNKFLQVAAKKNGWGFVDFCHPMMAINLREQKKDSLFTLEGTDRIHPDNDGHMVMAYLFLKAQGLSGEKVADISINVSDNKVEISDNCSISKLKTSKSKVEFNYLANSLPYPIDTIPRGWGNTKSQFDGCKLVPFIKEFDQEPLQVKNLNSGSYEFKMDDQPIGKFSAEDLQRGINLATLTNTPEYKQATQIMLLNEERLEIERRFRDYAWMEFSFFQDKGLLFADNQVALDTLRANMIKNIFVKGNFDVYSKAQYPEIRKVWQEEMNLIINTIYKINKPVVHHIQLVKIK